MFLFCKPISLPQFIYLVVVRFSLKHLILRKDKYFWKFGRDSIKPRFKHIKEYLFFDKNSFFPFFFVWKGGKGDC